jgi:pyridoxal phosphate enzyme (YggS family)
MPALSPLEVAQHYQQLKASLPSGVKLVIASKYANTEQLLALIEAGHMVFGENRMQQFEEQRTALLTAGLDHALIQKLEWHFIGHLQKNKINKTLGQFQLIHSVDSFELAEKLSQANHEKNLNQNVLLQLNLTQEPQKSGFLLDDYHQQLPLLQQLPGITLKGLMCFGPNAASIHDIETVFSMAQRELDMMKLQLNVPDLELSMGMSQDYVHALKFNATIIRVGRLLFESE